MPALTLRQTCKQLTQERRHTRALVKRLLPRWRSGMSGVEVGVFEGRTAAALLKYLPWLRLVLVDPYLPIPVAETWNKRDMGYVTDWPAAERQAHTAVAEWRHGVEWDKSASPFAAFGRDDLSYDFVFIDADHHYGAVRDDIAAWWPKVMPGGLLCGHDYNHKMEGLGWGVVKAVHEFASKNGLPVLPDSGHTWFIEKPRC